MPYVDPQIIVEVKKIDLLSYLQTYEPDSLVRIGNEYALKEHDSLRISDGIWHWHSRGIAGTTALHFLIKVRGMSFLDAVNSLAERAAVVPPVFMPNVERKDFVLPVAHSDNLRVIDYLTGRGIDREIIEFCIQAGILYESERYHNCVFVGRDGDGVARYAALRGTGESRFLGEAAGSDKRYSFSIVNRQSVGLHLFESAIDLLSFCTFQKLRGRDFREGNYLSLGGVSMSVKNEKVAKLPSPLAELLSRNPQTSRIYFHLDNDEAGRLATAAIRVAMPENIRAFNSPPSFGKDVNDCLRHYLQRQKNCEKRGGAR